MTSEPATGKAFEPTSVESFRFVDYAWDRATATARLHYAFEPGPDFIEEIRFPDARPTAGEREDQALDRCLRQLFLVCGVSYYKAAVPEHIVVEPFDLTPAGASFLGTLYREGLGEMAHQNGLDLSGLRFPYDPEARLAPIELALPRRTAVAVGGGKDSIVALELLAEAGEPMALLSVGDHGPVREVCEVARRRHPGLPMLRIQRQVSPQLLELNRCGALNGHIPISAVFAFLLATAGVLHGFDAAAVGNERSANVGSLVDGREVNHQYSKSFACEKAMAAWMRSEAVAGFDYFSVLRPLSELAIARAFAEMTDYHDVFLSCNAAFRLEGAATTWCGDCPKCRFVFLALAPFLERERLLAIFGGRDLLAQPEQTAGFRALAGLEGPKPFECVGEIMESAAALEALCQAPAWRDAPVLRALRDEVARFAASHRGELDSWSRVSSEHALPDRLCEAVLAVG